MRWKRRGFRDSERDGEACLLIDEGEGEEQGRKPREDEL
jgi:hypothetical protein